MLKVFLNENDKLLELTTADNKTSKPITLAKIALRDRNCELLELLFSLKSDTFNKQLTYMEDRDSLSAKFINTNDFDIWITIASNATIFTLH